MIRFRRTTVYLLVLFAGIVAAKIEVDALLKQIPPQMAPLLPSDTNTLNDAFARAVLRPVRIATNPPVELDGLSKEDVYRLRTARVRQYPGLVKGDYRPSGSVFGAIVDGKPWWGLRGQYCHAYGEQSIDGLSEESRFIANPFHLLYIDEAWAYSLPTGCCPAYTSGRPGCSGRGPGLWRWRSMTGAGSLPRGRRWA